MQVVNCGKVVTSHFPRRLQYQGNTVQIQHGTVCGVKLAQLGGFSWVDVDIAYGMSLLCLGHPSCPLQPITALTCLLQKVIPLTVTHIVAVLFS